MINQQTLQILLSNKCIETVTAECADLDLSDIQLFVTNEFEDRHKIHFLGKGKQPEINLYLIRRAEKELAQILNCDVVIRSVDDLNEIIKEEVLSNTAKYAKGKEEDIKAFFEQQILPRAENNFFLEKELQEEEEELAEKLLEKFKEDDIFDKLAEKFENDAELWHEVKQCPQALVTAVSKLVQKHELQLEVK